MNEKSFNYGPLKYDSPKQPLTRTQSSVVTFSTDGDGKDEAPQSQHADVTRTSSYDPSSAKGRRVIQQPKGTLVHEVAGGQSLDTIALIHNTTPTIIMRLNKLATRIVFPGQTLYVPDENAIEEDEPTSPRTVNELNISPIPELLATQSFNDISTTKAKTDWTLMGKFASNEDNKENISESPPQPNPARRRRRPRRLTREESIKLNDECTERFLKLNVVQHLPSKETVDGVMLVSPNALMFEPDLAHKLVKEHGKSRYDCIVPMHLIASVSMFAEVVHDRIRNSSEDVVANDDFFSPRISSSDEKFADNLSHVFSSTPPTSFAAKDLADDLPLFLRVSVLKQRPNSTSTVRSKIISDNNLPEYWFTVSPEKRKMERIIGELTKADKARLLKTPFNRNERFAISCFWSTLDQTDEASPKPPLERENSSGFVLLTDSGDHSATDVFDVLDSSFSKEWEIISKAEVERREILSLEFSLPNPDVVGKSTIFEPIHIKKIFGAYLSHCFHMTDTYYGTGESFVYKFHHNPPPEDKGQIDHSVEYGWIPEVFKWSEQNSLFMQATRTGGILIGGGEDGLCALRVDSELEMGASHPCNTFNSARLSKEPDFRVLVLEVWGFVDDEQLVYLNHDPSQDKVTLRPDESWDNQERSDCDTSGSL